MSKSLYTCWTKTILSHSKFDLSPFDLLCFDHLFYIYFHIVWIVVKKIYGIKSNGQMVKAACRANNLILICFNYFICTILYIFSFCLFYLEIHIHKIKTPLSSSLNINHSDYYLASSFLACRTRDGYKTNLSQRKRSNNPQPIHT